jgi:hypothetical protein
VVSRANGGFGKRLIVAVFGSILLCAAPAAHAAVAVEPVSPCFVDPPEGAEPGVPYDCGYVRVPEDWSASNGRTVKVGFLRLRARAAGKASPLFMLAGGPGSTLIEPEAFAFFNPLLLGAVLDTRDVVVLDQRGTRHSVPFLDCPDLQGVPGTPTAGG